MDRTPPGSETRACIHGGNSETWESQLSPCREHGVRGAVPEVGKTPGNGEQVLMLPNESCTQLLRAGNTNKVSNARYRGRIAKSEQTRNGLLAVLADHSTDGQKGV